MCTCGCPGCVAFDTRPGSRRRLASDEDIAMFLVLVIAGRLRVRGIDMAEPVVEGARRVARVTARVTAFACYLREMIEDPEDPAVIVRARESIERLAASLAAVVEGLPQLT